jgi:aldehyde:ferredoxin oxidoreductase
MLDEYYRLRGWDPETGWPTEEKLRELGLEEASPWLTSNALS